jgi:cell division protein FtsN
MANNGGRRSSPAPGNSSLVLGILIGMVLGLLVAGAVAWHLSNRPKAFALKDERTAPPVPATPPAAAPKPQEVTPAQQPASGVGGNGERFTFYKILTDKDHQAGHGTAHGAGPSRDTATAAAGTYFLQAGSFAKADEADRLKAKLALLGMEAAVLTAEVPGKGTYYRVRLGPYHTADEMNKANATLKENGIANAAPVRGAH